MTRAIITQLVEALETGWSPQFTGKDARALSDAAIKSAREYLTTEPSGGRAELIEKLRRIAAEGMADYASTGYPNSSAIRKAADMLEADASLRTQPVDKGPWCAGMTKQDARVYVQSDDFKRDARLYVNGDFATKNEEYLYACALARHLNAAADTHESDAQQAKRVPMTDSEIYSISRLHPRFCTLVPHLEVRDFARAIEAHHGITPADKPIVDEPEDLYALALKADNWSQP